MIPRIEGSPYILVAFNALHDPAFETRVCSTVGAWSDADAGSVASSEAVRDLREFFRIPVTRFTKSVRASRYTFQMCCF